ncbi:MAG: hypothetical protein NZ807_02935, partial [Dehalococcoidia bacterium]|nr:hypothetical protein [Dehalococcoidia bacterium]
MQDLICLALKRRRFSLPGGPVVGLELTAATDTQNRDEIWGQTGDKRGTQPPATPRTALQKKSQFVI